MTLLQKMAKDNTALRYKCSQCDFSTDSKRFLIYHHMIVKHTAAKDIKWLKCKHCAEKFATIYLLTDHVKKKHPDKSCLECLHCEEVCKNHKKLLLHMSQNHNHNIPKNVSDSFGEILADKEKKNSYSAGTRQLDKDGNKMFINDTNNEKKTSQTTSDSLERALLFAINDGDYITIRETNKGNKNIEIKCHNCPFKAKMVAQLNMHKKFCKNNNTAEIKKEQPSSPIKIKQEKVEIIIVKHPNGIKLFKCSICGKVSKFMVGIRNHIIICHTPNDQIKWRQCKYCEYKGKLPVYLDHHIKNAHRPNLKYNFQCPLCPYRARTKCSLQIHLGKIHKQSAIKKNESDDNMMEMPPIIVKQEKAEVITVQQANGLKLFKCSVCDVTMKLRRCLRDHITARHTAHDQIKWRQCKYCPYKGKTAKYLRSHMINSHNANLKYDFQCPKCPRRAATEADLQEHLVKIHKNVTKMTTKIGEDVQSGLSENKKSSKTNVKSSCPVKIKLASTINCFHHCKRCNGFFFTKFELKRHMKGTHADFKCGLCSFKTAYKYSLEQHTMRRHK